jgi:hypothetical protein
MFLLSVKMTSSSILEMQKSEWPETLNIVNTGVVSYLTLLDHNKYNRIAK